MKIKYLDKRGISLIVLVITIVVIVVLAVAVILSIANNNPIGNAKEARFKNDLKAIEEELNLYILKEYSNSLGENNGVNLAGDTLSNTLSSAKEYKDKVEIINGKMYVVKSKLSSEEIEWAKELEIEGFEYGTNGNTETNVAKVNEPELLTGMTPITFDTQGEAVNTITNDSNWYAYIDQGTYKTDGKTSKWANAQTEDGSEWVWIPRYAYKIKNPGTSTASEIEVIFLKGTTNTYEDENGELKNLPEGYNVHPAFTNESSINYANGGWDRELTGIWVAKYEAGFAGVGDIAEKTTAKESDLTYTGTYSNTGNIYGNIESGTTKITYPVFMPNAYSYNYINIGDAYAICRKIGEEGNPYGIQSNETHLMKNSEWGAVAYLTQSKYGRNGIEITVNSKNLKGTPSKIYAETGYGNGADDTYNTKNGQLASTTGNLYGIYDINGGTWERTAMYLNNDHNNLLANGKPMVDLDNDGKIDKISNKYISIYNVGTTDESLDNYNESINKKRIGEALWESSRTGNSSNGSWFSDYSSFSYVFYPFMVRGGYYDGNTEAGAFAFYGADGSARVHYGFRAVISGY